MPPAGFFVGYRVDELRGLPCPSTPAARNARKRRDLAPKLPSLPQPAIVIGVGRSYPECRWAKTPSSFSPICTLGLPCVFPGRSLPLVAGALGKRNPLQLSGLGALVVAGSDCSFAGAPPPPYPRASLRSGLALRVFRFGLFRVLDGTICGMLICPIAFSYYIREGRHGRRFGFRLWGCRVTSSLWSLGTRHPHLLHPVAPAVPPKVVSVRGLAMPPLRSGQSPAPSGLFCRLPLTVAPNMCGDGCASNPLSSAGGFPEPPPACGSGGMRLPLPLPFLILWRRLVLALRASAPTDAVSCGRGPNSPPLCASGGPVAPSPRPRSLWSRPRRVAGASGERCPASRGFLIG